MKPYIFRSNYLRKIFSSGYLPRWFVLFVDTALCIFAYLLAFEFSVRYYYNVYTGSDTSFNFFFFGITIALQVVWFFISKTYAGIIRYSTLIDAIKLLYAIAANTVTLFVLSYILTKYDFAGFRSLTILSYSLISFFFLLILRMIVKTLYDHLMRNNVAVTSVLVYGTKSAGVAIAQMIMSSNDSKYRVVGFIDNKAETNKFILGLPIYSVDEEERLFKAVHRKNVSAIIVSPIKVSELDMTTDLDIFINKGMKIFVMPQLDKLKEKSELTYNHINVDKNLKKLQIEDLLNRKAIVIDKIPVKEALRGKVVMVTGAAGSIGSEIVRQLSDLDTSRIILLDNAETPLHNIKLEIAERWPDKDYVITIADVRNRGAIENAMSVYKPDYVFHAAAYKHVPMMEEHPSECIVANVMGTKNVADMAVKYGVRSFVMVSTDKAVNPTNVMGCSKRIAEIYIQSYFKKLVKDNPDTTQFVTTRFGNVLGSNGSVIPLFKKQIAEGGPVTVTHPDIIRFFMTIPEACQLVLEAGTIGKGGNIYVFDMGTPVKIVDLARKMIHMAGLEPEKDIKIVYSGLRPGEKLYEELLNSEERVRSSVNDKIMVAATREYEYDAIVQPIDSLIESALNFADEEVVRQMKAFVPEYISQNSKYSSLDNK